MSCDQYIVSNCSFYRNIGLILRKCIFLNDIPHGTPCKARWGWDVRPEVSTEENVSRRWANYVDWTNSRHWSATNFQSWWRFQHHFFIVISEGDRFQSLVVIQQSQGRDLKLNCLKTRNASRWVKVNTKFRGRTNSIISFNMIWAE